MFKNGLYRINKTLLTAAAVLGVTVQAAMAVNVTVTVKDGSNQGVSGATVYAIRFTTSGPDANKSTMGATGGDGTVILSLDASIDYEIFASKLGLGPTVRSQMFNPTHQRYYSGGSTAITVTLDQTLENRGKITATVQNVTDGKMIFGNVRKISTGKDVAFAACLDEAGGDTTCVMEFDVAVPSPNVANFYEVSAFDPSGKAGQGSGYGAPLTSPFVDNEAAITLNLNNGLPPDTSASSGDQKPMGGSQADPNSGGIVRGVVEDEGNANIFVPWGGINLMVREGSNIFDRFWANIDQNGRFEFRGLEAGVTYYVKTYGGCVPGGDCYLGDDGRDRALTGAGTPNANDILLVSTATAYIHHVKLSTAPAGTGNLRINVRNDQGVLIPGAWVSIWGDGSQWHDENEPTHTLNCPGDPNAMISSQSFTNKNVRADTGYVLLTDLPVGNITISVGSPFGQGMVNYNAGADQVFNWGPGQHGCFSGSSDDRRVMVKGDDSVAVYNTSGTVVAGAVTTVAGVSSITIIIPTLNDGAGTFNGTLNFSEVVDLSNDPITIQLQYCSDGGCQGNFAAITGSGSSIPFEVKVPTSTDEGEPIDYQLTIISKYWGLVRTGGGQQSVSFATTDTVTRNMKFLPAGIVSGYVYKPDRKSVFKPGQQAGGGWIGGSVNADGSNAWGWSEIQQTGHFMIGGLLPGTYELFAQVWGGTVDYSSKEPKDKVVVTAGQEITKDVYFVNGALVTVDMSTSSLPSLVKVYNPFWEYWGGESWRVYRLPAGTPFNLDKIYPVLDNENEDYIKIQWADENGRCGMDFEGWCPSRAPSENPWDFYAVRFGEMEATTNIHNYFTIIGNLKDVVTDAAHASLPNVYMMSSTYTPVHLSFDTSGVTSGSILTGQVIAQNIFRQVDFESFGGSFDNWVKFLPVITLNDADGTLVSAGMVTPLPSSLPDGSPQMIGIEESIAESNFSKFLQAVEGLTWSYEIRGIPQGAYTMVATTPNYPPIVKRIPIGADGTTLEENLNWDEEIGAGGTISGVVQSTGSVLLANATVKIKGRGIKTKEISTGANGDFTAEGLPSGKYKVTVTADDFAGQAQKVVVAGGETTAVSFTMVAAPGVITGMVREVTLTESGPLSKPIADVRISAYDDTLNGTDTETPLALVKSQTDSSGEYRLTGLVAGHTYKVFARAPGRYLETQDVAATGGTVADVNFDLKQKPLDIDITIRQRGTNFEIKIANPNNFDSGELWYYDSAVAWSEGIATAVTIDNTNEKPDGSIVKLLPLNQFTDGVTYKLRIEATPASDDPVVIKELTFGRHITGNAQRTIDQAISGDDEKGDDNIDTNEVTAGDNTSLVIEPGSVDMGADAAEFPIARIKGTEDSGAGSAAGDVTLVGNTYELTLGNVQFTDRKAQLNLVYDGETVGTGINGLAIYRLNPASGEYEPLEGDLTVDPVSFTASIDVDLNTLLSSEADLNGSSVRRTGKMSALWDGKKYGINPYAAGSGASIFAVGLAQTGRTATAYKQYNFPNPFNLKDKTVTLINGLGGNVGVNIRGTYIVIGTPGTGTALGTVRIYNVAGDMVRELQATLTLGQYNYIHWDGKNTAGSDVASGVYFARIDAPGANKKKPIKMVVVK